jgi:hypothetical protein
VPDLPGNITSIVFPHTIVGEIILRDYNLGIGAIALLTDSSKILINVELLEKKVPFGLATVIPFSSSLGLSLYGGFFSNAAAFLNFEGSTTGVFEQIFYGAATATVTTSSQQQMLIDAPFVEIPEFNEAVDGDFWVDYVPQRVALKFNLSTLSIIAKAELRSKQKLMLLKDVVLNIYSLWGYDGLISTSQIAIGRDRIVQYCNTAMQMIYSRADRLNYFNRSVLDVTIDDTGKVELPQTIQRLLGPVKVDNRPLQSLGSQVEVDNFTNWYLNGDELISPIAFFAETQRASERDSVNITLHILPPPPATTSVLVKVDVVMEPQRFDDADVLKGIILELPHLWVESLFLPIVRKLAAGDNLMNKAKLASVSAEINSQYESARQMLGLADTAPPPVQRKREEAIPA